MVRATQTSHLSKLSIFTAFSKGFSLTLPNITVRDIHMHNASYPNAVFQVLLWDYSIIRKCGKREKDKQPKNNSHQPWSSLKPSSCPHMFPHAQDSDDQIASLGAKPKHALRTPLRSARLVLPCDFPLKAQTETLTAFSPLGHSLDAVPFLGRV